MDEKTLIEEVKKLWVASWEEYDKKTKMVLTPNTMVQANSHLIEQTVKFVLEVAQYRCGTCGSNHVERV